MFFLNVLLCVYLLGYGIATPGRRARGEEQARGEDSSGLVRLSGLDAHDSDFGDDYIENKFSENKISSLTTYCTTTSSCGSSTISDDDVRCYGFWSCDSATITASTYLRCYGCLACRYATLTTSSSSALMQCYGQNACYGSTITVTNGSPVYLIGEVSGRYSTISASYSTVYCQGYLACSYSVITANITYIDDKNAGNNANITSYSELISSGSNSLSNSQIYETPYIYDYGDYTFNNATISSYGLSRLEIASRGYYSTSNSIVLCYSGSKCFIRCQGDESCDGMNLYCEYGATCNTFCYACASCPTIHNVTQIDDTLLLLLFSKNNINHDIDQVNENEIKDLVIHFDGDYYDNKNIINNMGIMDFINEKYGKYAIYIIISIVSINIIILLFVLVKLYKFLNKNVRQNCCSTLKNKKVVECHYQYQSI